MGTQARSVETRQKILEGAVELFAENGFEGTTLRDITDYAQITTGTFYYHFASKEALVPAVIDQGWPIIWKVVTAWTESRFPSLENVIGVTFEVISLISSDKSVLVSVRLDQAFSQLSADGREGFQSRSKMFTEAVAAAISRTDIREEVSPQCVGELVWIHVHGCHQLSEAMRDDPIARLKTCWQVLLRAIVPPSSLSYFLQFMTRVSATYAAGPLGQSSVDPNAD